MLGLRSFLENQPVIKPILKVKSDHRRRSLKKIRASTEFEPVTSAIPVRCSTNWAMKQLNKLTSLPMCGFIAQKVGRVFCNLADITYRRITLNYTNFTNFRRHSVRRKVSRGWAHDATSNDHNVVDFPLHWYDAANLPWGPDPLRQRTAINKRKFQLPLFQYEIYIVLCFVWILRDILSRFAFFITIDFLQMSRNIDYFCIFLKTKT